MRKFFLLNLVIGSMIVALASCNGGFTMNTPNSPSTDSGDNYTAVVTVSVSSDKSVLTVNGNVTLNLIKVNSGTFQMGCADGDDIDKPVHSVTLSDYYIGETEVTQALWKAVMGGNPSYWKNDNLPVEQVSWDDCQKFIAKLNQLTGKTFALPTEAQWEFAARGGNKSQGYKYAGSNKIDDVAWYGDNSSKKTHYVAQKQSNELGLYDMCGNVWEWCSDWFGYYTSAPQTDPIGPSSGTERLQRGGSHYTGATVCTSTSRWTCTPETRVDNVGLRLVLIP